MVITFRIHRVIFEFHLLSNIYILTYAQHTHTIIFISIYFSITYMIYIKCYFLIELTLLEIHASSLLIDMSYLLSHSFSFNILANYT